MIKSTGPSVIVSALNILNNLLRVQFFTNLMFYIALGYDGINLYFDEKDRIEMAQLPEIDRLDIE